MSDAALNSVAVRIAAFISSASNTLKYDTLKYETILSRFKWRYVLSYLLLSTLSARAQAPAPSQEFWNYFVEFGDEQGELFDPSDYAAVANLPEKTQREIDSTMKTSKPEQQVPRATSGAQESSQ